MNLDLSPPVVARADAAVPLNGHPLPAASPFVSVSALVQALRRRWRLWTTSAVAGLMAAMALSLAFPPPYSATTTLLLRATTQSDPSRAMKTDAELLKTRTVAQGVIERLGLPLSADELISHYGATVLSDSVLQITVNGPTGDEAVLWAGALTEEFLRFRRDEYERQSDVVIRLLGERQGALRAELGGLVQRINSFAPGSDARTLGDLLTRRTAVISELDELGQRIDEMRIETALAVENSRVVDPASEAGRSPLKPMAANMAAGIVGGLALGMGWVVLAEVASDRVRRRHEVMRSLGAPVPASIGPLRGPLWGQRQRFRRHLAHPRGDVTQVVRHLRRTLSRSGTARPALVAVSVHSDGPAALLVGSTAAELVKEGKNVLLADLSRRSALAALFRMPAGQTSSVGLEGTESRLWVYCPRGELRDTPEDGRAELDVQLPVKPDIVLALATLDPALGAGHLKAWATTAVAVVTSGRSTPIALRSLSQMLTGAGLELTSAVLVGADRHDESFGGPAPPPRQSREPALVADR